MADIKKDPSDIYDEEFLRKKEEFYASLEKPVINSVKYEISEDDSSFEGLIDDFDDGSSKKQKKSKKKNDEMAEVEYDIFDLQDKFGIEEDKSSKWGKKKKEKKEKAKKSAPAPVKAPQKPREPLKPFVPHTPVEQIKADVYVKDEELYKQQNVDIDELLKNLGIPSLEETAEVKADEFEDISSGEQDDDTFAKAVKEGTVEISSVSDTEEAADDGRTRNFDISQKEEAEGASGETKHFNLKTYIQSAGQAIQDTKKNTSSFTQHFRFLKNKESDEAIIESAPTGKGKDSMMDSVRADEGEDIFTAVEKAQKSKKKRHSSKRSTVSLAEYEEKLSASVSKSKKNLLILGILFVVSFVLTVLPSLYNPDGALEFLFGKRAFLFGVINLAVIGVAAFISKDEIVLGFNNIRYFSPDRNSVTFILGAFVLLYDLIAMIFGTLGLNGIKPYTLCFVFAVAVRALGEYLETLSAYKGVNALSAKGRYEGVHYVSSKNDAMAIAHGLSEKNVPTILYGAESRAEEGIREERMPKDDEDKFYSFTGIAVLVVGFVAGVVLFIRSREAISFITALVSCVCFCLPVMNEFVSSLFFYDSSRRLAKKGACANDMESLEILSNAKAVSADAKELFTCDVSSFKKVKGAPLSKGDAAIFAAVALKAGGSMVGDCFEDFISSLDIELPEAEDVQYEEKLGVACWIAERRVLVGNRQMLVEHSIDAPSEAQEKAYAGKKNVMYVVVEGQLIASFLVKYKVVSSFRKIAADFDKTGLVLMINSFEPCLDEFNCAVRLSLDVAAVKVLSQKSAELINSYKDDPSKGKATALVCLKGENNLMNLVVKAHSLYQGDKLISNLLLAGQGIALVLVFLSVLLNMPVFFNPVTILVLQILWSFVGFTAASGDFRKLVKVKAGSLIEKVRKLK